MVRFTNNDNINFKLVIYYDNFVDMRSSMFETLNWDKLGFKHKFYAN